MADLRNIVLGSLLFMAIVTGWYASWNDYFNYEGVSQVSSGYNQSAFIRSSNFINSWANQTSVALANAQAVPILGNFYILAVGAFQAITLFVGLAPNVLLPLVGDIAVALLLPSWFVGFIIASLVIVVLVAIVNAMKGGPV